MQDYLKSEQDQFIEQSQAFFPAAMALKISASWEPEIDNFLRLA